MVKDIEAKQSNMIISFFIILNYLISYFLKCIKCIVWPGYINNIQVSLTTGQQRIKFSLTIPSSNKILIGKKAKAIAKPGDNQRVL